MRFGVLLVAPTHAARVINILFSRLQPGTTLKQEVLIFFQNFPDAFLSFRTWSQSAAPPALLSFEGGLAWDRADLSGGDGMERGALSRLATFKLLREFLESF